MRIFRMIAVAFGMTVAGVALSAAPATAAPAPQAPCIAGLATSVPGGMADTVTFWQDDFLNLGQPAGHYAVFIAHIRQPQCPA